MKNIVTLESQPITSTLNIFFDAIPFLLPFLAVGLVIVFIILAFNILTSSLGTHQIYHSSRVRNSALPIDTDLPNPFKRI